jgi:DNA-binding response OmpR family regulator
VRLLLIEDDRKAARLLARGFQEEGFVVDVAETGEAGEEQATVNEYDVIVLDWLLPGKDGIAVCRALRERDLATPILMLTARHSLTDRVNGLTTGADDYLTKPSPSCSRGRGRCSADRGWPGLPCSGLPI